MRKLLSKSTQKFLMSQKFMPTLRFSTQTQSQQFQQISKVVSTVDEAIADIKSGSSILFGGFGVCGIPENTINALARKQHIKDLVAISNDPGQPDFGLGQLVNNQQIKRLVCSFMESNIDVEMKYINGEIEVELIPAGTLSEKIRSGGVGVGGFYTPAGLNTLVEQGGIPIKMKEGMPGDPEILSQPKERKIFNGKPYLFEESIRADFAVIKAQIADTKGNLVFNASARNFNEDMAKCGKITIAEVEEIVECGKIHPNQVHVPGIFVDRVFKGNFEKRVQRLMVNRGVDVELDPYDETQRQKQLLIKKVLPRAIKELKSGMYVNLGIGIPALIPRFIPKDMEIDFQSENGILGYGDFPKPGFHDPEVINAGKQTVVSNPGAAFMGSADAFAIIRGQHLDVVFLGAYQVSAGGDIASWMIPGWQVKGMGSAMDLVHSGAKNIVLMSHTYKGAKKILEKCTLPITGSGIVNMIITDQAVFEIKNGQLILKEISTETSLENVRNLTGARFQVADNLGKF